MQGFSVATFNALDFFDDKPPHVIAGLDRDGWSPERQADATRFYRRKLNVIARILTRLDADIVVLQEIKGNSVLEQLRQRLAPRYLATGDEPYGGYHRPLSARPGRRGIAVGVLTRWPIIEATEHAPDELPFPNFLEGDPHPFAGRLRLHRPMLELILERPDGGKLALIGLHLKSHLPLPLVDGSGDWKRITSLDERAQAYARSFVARLAEALFVRRRVSDLLKRGLPVIVAGDFNDQPDAASLRIIAGDIGGPTDLSDPERLLNCMRAMPSHKRYSTMHNGERRLIDHVLVSSALWQTLKRVDIFHDEIDQTSASEFNPASDHAPLRVEFTGW